MHTHVAKYGLMFTLKFFLSGGSLHKLHYCIKYLNTTSAQFHCLVCYSSSMLDENASEKTMPVPYVDMRCLLKAEVSVLWQAVPLLNCMQAASSPLLPNEE